MPNNLFVNQISEIIEAKFRKFKEIRSAYLYGSVLTDAFHKESDIDLLFIVDDVFDRFLFLKKIKSVRSQVKSYKLDVNVVFYSEYIRLWHIFRPPTFFVWIKQRNKLLWGDDCIRNIKEDEITMQSIYKRSVDLAQGCRAVYLNNKDVVFWEIRYSRWLRELQYGILYLHGELELDSKLCNKKLCEVFPEVKVAKLLSKKQLPIEQLSKIAETFVSCIYNRFVEPA